MFEQKFPIIVFLFHNDNFDLGLLFNLKGALNNLIVFNENNSWLGQRSLFDSDPFVQVLDGLKAFYNLFYSRLNEVRLILALFVRLLGRITEVLFLHLNSLVLLQGLRFYIIVNHSLLLLVNILSRFHLFLLRIEIELYFLELKLKLFDILCILWKFLLNFIFVQCILFYSQFLYLFCFQGPRFFSFYLNNLDCGHFDLFLWHFLSWADQVFLLLELFWFIFLLI